MSYLIGGAYDGKTVLEVRGTIIDEVIKIAGSGNAGDILISQAMAHAAYLIERRFPVEIDEEGNVTP